MQKGLLHTNNKDGFSLIEILLTVSIFTLTILTVISMLSANETSLKRSSQYNEANYYLTQGLEAVKNIKDNSFANLSAGTYGLIQSGSVWQLSGASDNTNGYIRTIAITATDNITRFVTAQIQWLNNSNQSQVISASLTLKDWNRYGATPTPTLTPTNTPTPTVTPTPTPTVVPINWTTPTLVVSSNLTPAASVVGLVQSGNYIYGVLSGTANNFFIANVTNPAVPTFAYLTIAQTLTSVAVLNNTAYVGSTNNAGEIYVVNITTKTAPALATGVTNPINLTGNDDATSLWVDSALNRLYIGRLATGSAAEIYIYNTTTNNAPTLVTTYNIAGNNHQVTNMYKNGNYLYVTTNMTNNELHVINLTNEGSITGTNYDVTGAFTGQAVTGYGNRLFVTNSNSQMFVLDITTPTAPTVLGTYAASGLINGLAVNQTKQLAFLGVASTATATNEFQVVNIATPASMSLYGSYNPTGNNSYTEVVYDPTVDRCYVGTNITTGEFVVLRPGP